MRKFLLILMIAAFWSGPLSAQYMINSVGDAGRDPDAVFAICDTGNTVTNPDTGQPVTECTLRALIETINELTSGNPATVGFVDWIPTTGTPASTVISPQTPLPGIEWPLHLDGTTHPDFDEETRMPRVVLEGELLSDSVPPQAANGLFVASSGSGSQIESINIREFRDAGIAIVANNVRVNGSHIGTDASGNVALPNGLGVVINGNNNLIGNPAQALGPPSTSPTTNRRNVISGNSNAGVWVFSGQGNRIVDNHIGVNVSGTTAMPSGNGGVLVDNDAVGTIIGENFTGSPANIAGNLISGHEHVGVEVRGSGTLIRCNYFGWRRFLDDIVDADAVAIEIIGSSASETVVGQENCPNLIRATDTAVRVGSSVESAGANNRIEWNYIGTTGAGADPGVIMPDGVVVHASSSTRVADNVIGYAEVGIELYGDSSGVTVAGNRLGVMPAGNSVPLGPEPIFVAGSDHSIEENIIGHAGSGIIVTSDGNDIRFNRIGTGHAGESWPVGEFGIDVWGNDNILFGNFVGNAEIGIVVEGNGNLVRRNFVGTILHNGDFVDIGNSEVGIKVTGSGNDIGGTLSTDANLIGFNGGPGVRLVGASNRVRRNNIGVSGNGHSLGNQGPGVEVQSSASSTRISEIPDEGNHIGNNQVGIAVHAPFTIIVGNTLGSSFVGGIHGNQNRGILIGDGVSDSIIELNTIAHTSGTGVWLENGAGQRNRILRTEFFGNDGKGIHLGPGGRDQDPGDADTGPNNLQNFPEFDLRNSGYNPDTGKIDLEFRVDSHPDNSIYPIGIEIFLVDPDSVRAQGMVFLAEYLYEQTDAQQWVSVELDPPGGVELAEFDELVATATTADGNTSEFSEPFGMAPFVSIGGEVIGLDGTIVLQDDFGGTVSIANVGTVPFTMPNDYYPDEDWSITISPGGMPSGQECEVVPDSGTVGHSDITDIQVICQEIGDELFSDRFELLLPQM